MISIKEAFELATNCIGKPNFCIEYKNYFVMEALSENASEGGQGRVAISKTNGECCTFIAVIGKLGDELHWFSIDSEGNFWEVPIDED